MMNSLFAGVSGLASSQTQMDVIGNNIANVNTTAFKSSRVSFKEGFAQILQGASRGTDTEGGTNALQVGSGVQIGSIDTNFTQGTLESTGNATDLAIQGPSFFVLAKGAEQFYSRAGDFSLDASGKLVSQTDGYAVQGRMATNGVFSDTISDITLPLGQAVAAKATTSVTLSGNLDASAPVFDPGAAASVDALDPTQRALPQNANSYKDLSMTVYDSLGTPQDLKIVMWKTGANTWDWKANSAGMDVTAAGVTEVAGTHPITFQPDGEVDTSGGFVPPQLTFTPNSGAAPVTITLNPSTLAGGGLTQYAGDSSAVMKEQDGYGAGTLEDFSIDRTGTIVGTFTNGTSASLAQLSLADFNNPEGLVKGGDNMYQTSPNSGAAVQSFAGQDTASSITGGSLELSNVDLAQEFTNMIIAQRGFQANGRVITTSDQMLETLVSLGQ